jgi:hypothetical protein
MMEFIDDNMEEEKDELSNELVASLSENHYFRGASRQVAPSGL